MKNGHTATKKKTGKLTIPVVYGTISFPNDKTANIGITIRRGEINSPSIYDADKNLCGRQITASILARPEGAGPDQPGMFGDDGDLQIDGLFKIPSLSVTPAQISAQLSLDLTKIDRDKLTHFAKREGLLTINHVHDLAGKPAETAE